MPSCLVFYLHDYAVSEQLIPLQSVKVLAVIF